MLPRLSDKQPPAGVCFLAQEPEKCEHVHPYQVRKVRKPQTVGAAKASNIIRTGGTSYKETHHFRIFQAETCKSECPRSLPSPRLCFYHTAH